MFLLIAAGIGGGLIASALLVPVSLLAALIIAPLVASATAILACFLIAWRTSAEARAPLDLDARADVMVAALRQVAQRSTSPSPAPRVGLRPRSAAKAG